MAEQQVQKSLDLTIKLATRLYCVVWPRRKLWIPEEPNWVEKKFEPNKEVGKKERRGDGGKGRVEMRKIGWKWWWCEVRVRWGSGWGGGGGGGGSGDNDSDDVGVFYNQDTLLLMPHIKRTPCSPTTGLSLERLGQLSFGISPYVSSSFLISAVDNRPHHLFHPFV